MILGLPLQTPSVKTGKGAGVEHLVTALVARRYYLDGQTKSQIADELGVSRFKVARILETAVRDGIVRISIDIPPEVDLDLSQKLEQRFGLRQVLVVRTEEDGTLDAMRRMLGRACASLLAGACPTPICSASPGDAPCTPSPTSYPHFHTPGWCKWSAACPPPT